MGANLSELDDYDVTRKAIVPFRVRNNGFQVDYQILKFRSFTKAKIDQATDTKYDDSFLELNTRSKIVGDIRKVLTISAESISEDYATLRKNYYSRICFGVLTFFVGLVMTNIGWLDNTQPKGRVLIIFGGLMLMLTFVTLILVIYTDRKLKQLNRQFVQKCVKILEKEKIVTWGASFQHLLFDIIYPYHGRSGAGAVILTPNPYFEMVTKNTDDLEEMEIKVDDPSRKSKMHRLPIPMPQWVVDESVSREEHKPLIGAGLLERGQFGQCALNPAASPPLILPPSDDSFQGPVMPMIPVAYLTESSGSESPDLRQPSDDADDEDMNESDKLIPDENAKGKKDEQQAKPAPKPYTGFDDTSKEIARKIHGDLAQRYFHNAPEDIEGFGHDTQLEQLMDVKEQAPSK